MACSVTGVSAKLVTTTSTADAPVVGPWHWPHCSWIEVSTSSSGKVACDREGEAGSARTDTDAVSDCPACSAPDSPTSSTSLVEPAMRARCTTPKDDPRLTSTYWLTWSDDSTLSALVASAAGTLSSTSVSAPVPDTPIWFHSGAPPIAHCPYTRQVEPVLQLLQKRADVTTIDRTWYVKLAAADFFARTKVDPAAAPGGGAAAPMYSTVSATLPVCAAAGTDAVTTTPSTVFCSPSTLQLTPSHRFAPNDTATSASDLTLGKFLAVMVTELSPAAVVVPSGAARVGVTCTDGGVKNSNANAMSHSRAAASAVMLDSRLHAETRSTDPCTRPAACPEGVRTVKRTLRGVAL
mmetsp:Transcript_4174/g.11923  ORF Transcript_4174/g.11923 Transcript_4174/m.11923 type:complete len:351 (-) Transcript_4174:203-1255(-)